MATRNYRVGELEIKPNYTSVVRGYNFDSRYYVNDKDAPAEDIADYSGLSDPGPFTENCYPLPIGAWYVNPLSHIEQYQVQQVPFSPSNFATQPGWAYQNYYIVVAATRPFYQIYYNCCFDVAGDLGPAVSLATVWPFGYDSNLLWGGGGWYGSQSLSESNEAFKTATDNGWGHIKWNGTWDNYDLSRWTAQAGNNHGVWPNYYYPYLFKDAICNIWVDPNSIGASYVWRKGVNPNGFLQYAPQNWRESLYNHYVAIWPPGGFGSRVWRPIDGNVFSGYGQIPANGYAGLFNFIGVG